MCQQPKIRVDSVRVVFNDGNHNAFTDLGRFRDRYYLTFRSCPDGHMVFPSSRIVILSSGDARKWEQVYAFSVPDRDVRDPHLLVFGDRLFVYTGTWLCDPTDPARRDVNDHLGYGVWTDDGRSWEGPHFLEGTYGHYIWRAATYQGKAYLNGRRKRAFLRPTASEEQGALLQSVLMESEDGLIWRMVGFFQEAYGDETAFLFEDDGSILAIARGRASRTAELCRSHPPYTKWSRKPLVRNVGGPLLAKWGERYLVGGRKWGGPEGPKTALCWLIEDQLEEVVELPSGGDNSYPGFIQLTEARGLLSYYSSHAGSGTELAPSAIYLAELSLE